MPRQKRYALKQKLNSANAGIEKAISCIVEVGRLYEENHPEYYEKFAELVALLDMANAALTEIKDSI